MKSPYADSTIAISIYNTLVVFGGPMGRDDLFEAVRIQHHRDLQKEQFDVSLHKLVSKMRLVRLIEDRFHTVDQQRRIIVGRNRNDIKEENGHCIGGWEWWVWKSPGGAISKVFEKRGQG